LGVSRETVTVTLEVVLDIASDAGLGEALFWRGLSGDGGGAPKACGPRLRARATAAATGLQTPLFIYATSLTRFIVLRCNRLNSITRSRPNSDESGSPNAKLGGGPNATLNGTFSQGSG